MNRPHVLDLKRAQVDGCQLLAANDPRLSKEDAAERDAFYQEADRGYERQKAAGFPDRHERALHEQMDRQPA